MAWAICEQCLPSLRCWCPWLGNWAHNPELGRPTHCWPSCRGWLVCIGSSDMLSMMLRWHWWLWWCTADIFKDEHLGQRFCARGQWKYTVTRTGWLSLPLAPILNCSLAACCIVGGAVTTLTCGLKLRGGHGYWHMVLSLVKIMLNQQYASCHCSKG